MKITTIGIDLAKNVFQGHAVNERGQAVLNKQLKRSQVMAFFANLPPCLVGMESCGSAHHWARKLEGLGYTARLIATQFVKPYVKMVWAPPFSRDVEKLMVELYAIAKRTGSSESLTSKRQGNEATTESCFFQQ